MSATVGFYLLGYKGFHVLSEFVRKLGASSIGFVVAATDSGVANDFFTETSEFAGKHKLKFLNRAALETAEPPDADVTFAVGWRWMLPGDGKVIVFHDSLLPRYRGFAPLVNALVTGEKTIGVTALVAVEDYDSGPIIAQQSTDISYPIKINEAIERVVPFYADLAISVFREFSASGSLQSDAQDNAQASYSPWRDDLDYVIPWSESAAYIKRFCDAVGSPYEGAVAWWECRKIRVTEVSELPDVDIMDRPRHIGKVIFKNAGHPAVICGSGLIEITQARFEDTGEFIFAKLPFRVRFRESPR